MTPILEYNCQIWSPTYVLPYPERLHHLGTDSLTLRRLKLALVTFYNIIHNNIDVGESLFDIVNHSVIYECNTYTVGHKKRATLFGIITPMFRGGFLHFLHQWKQEKILYRGITQFATLPQLCLYTT